MDQTESPLLIDQLAHEQVALPYNASASETSVHEEHEMLGQAIHDPLHHLSNPDNTLQKIHYH